MDNFMVQMIGLGLGTGLQVGLITLVLCWVWRVRDIIS